MRIHSLLIASVITTVFALPAMAQQATTMQRYAILFKYTEQAVKAMTENPQDREAAARRLSESLGGKSESIYFFTTNGEYDGIAIGQVPNEAAQEALILMLRSTGNFAKAESIPAMTAAEFKAAMEKAKGTTTTYTPPTATKQ
jgi:uncharacterized protein with GYD domain